LDYQYGDAPINSMSYFGTALLAVVDNGAYGVQLGDTVNWSGQTLVLIDPTVDPTMSYYVSPLFEMPNRSSYKATVDAIVVPSDAFTFGATAQSRLVHAHWTPLQPHGNAQLATQKLQHAAHRTATASH